MNKKLIKKYKKEFFHWLNEGEILIKSCGKWLTEQKELGRNYQWATESEIIIIKDMYVEFRKAIAEGKVVQFKDSSLDNNSIEYVYKDIYYDVSEYDIKSLRIKPDVD